MMKESSFPLTKSLVETIIDKVLQDEDEVKSRGGRASSAAASVVTTSSSMPSTEKERRDDDDNGLPSSATSTTSSSISSSSAVVGIPANKKQKVEEEATMVNSWSSVDCRSQYQVRQIKGDNDWNTIMSTKVRPKHPTTSAAGEAGVAATVEVVQDKKKGAKNIIVKLPLYFGIQILQTKQQKTDAEDRGGKQQHDAVIVGFITFYIAYSTWDGRFIFVDHIRTSSNDDTGNEEGDVAATLTTISDEETLQTKMEVYLLQLVAKIAIELQCSRVTWTITKHDKEDAVTSWYNDTNSTIPKPEILHEWLLLSMNQQAMIKYTSEFNDGTLVPSNTAANDDDDDGVALSLTGDYVRTTIQQCLNSINESDLGCRNDDYYYTLRLASTSQDAEECICRLVKGLATYEKEPDAVNIGSKEYIQDGGLRNGEDPIFYCILLDHHDRRGGDHGDEDDGGNTIAKEKTTTCGMAFIYFGYSLVDDDNDQDGNGNGNGAGSNFLYLEDLFIEEEYRKGGGGTILMKALAYISLQLKCINSMRWVALDWNTPAINFYQQKIGATIQQHKKLIRYTTTAGTSTSTLQQFANTTH